MGDSYSRRRDGQAKKIADAHIPEQRLGVEEIQRHLVCRQHRYLHSKTLAIAAGSPWAGERRRDSVRSKLSKLIT